jgi:nucleoside-diphosphate-sugar epimerase
MGKILVTGAGGFIGYNLCHLLGQEGKQIVGIDHKYPSDDYNGNIAGINLHVGDFRDLDLMQKLLIKVDLVIHLASAHLQISLDHDQYWNINVHSLQPFLELCHSKGVKRFIHISSVGAYGNLANIPADENTPCRPQSIYGETKLAGEKVVLNFHEKTGFPIVVIRPAWVYGPYCPRTIKLYRTLRNKKFLMVGKGENLRHPVYVLDFFQALKLAMQGEKALGEILLIAGDRAITTKELINSYAAVMGFPVPKIGIPYWSGLLLAKLVETLFGLISKEPPFSRRTLEFFDTDNAFNIDKARQILGYKPKFSFEAGLADCRGWLEANAN